MTTTTTEFKQLTLKKADGVAEIHIHVNKSNAYDIEYYREFGALYEIDGQREISIVTETMIQALEQKRATSR